MISQKAEIKDYQRQVFRMAIQRIVINQQFAQIGVRTTPGQMRINKPKAQMSIQAQTPQLQINTTRPSFRVNHAKINNELGLKAPLELAKTFRDKGKQVALRAAGQAKDDGNFLANHRIPGDKSIPMLSRNKSMARLRDRETNIGLMPASLPEITWQKGGVDINFSRHSIAVNYDGDFMPETSLAGGPSVEVSLRTRPSFSVSVVDAHTASTLGNYINRMV